jgi:hypothetical protein
MLRYWLTKPARRSSPGNSDFLTLHNVYTIWKKMSTHPNTVRTWCRKNFLSQQVSLGVPAPWRGDCG